MVACPGSVGLENEGLGLGLSSSFGDGGEVSRVLEGSGSGVSQLSIGIAPLIRMGGGGGGCCWVLNCGGV
jgi:hypothetical protein